MENHIGKFATVCCLGGDPKTFIRQGYIAKHTDTELIVLGFSGCVYRGDLTRQVMVVADYDLPFDVFHWVSTLRQSKSEVQRQLSQATIGD